MINNEFDAGAIMQPGVFEAARASNPNIVSWNTSGPSWGAPDACLYTLGLNTRWGPTADVRVRRRSARRSTASSWSTWPTKAATVTAVVPFSTYGGLAAYETQLQPIIDQYKPDNPDPTQVAVEHAGGRLRQGRGRLLGQGRHPADRSTCRRRAG